MTPGYTHDPISGTHISLQPTPRPLTEGERQSQIEKRYTHDPISGTHMTLTPVGPEVSAAHISTARLETFCDGVFAIVITLLVLTFRPPTDLAPANPKDLDALLTAGLAKMMPSMLSYALSFILVGIFWVAHHNIFHYIERLNRTFIWLNLLLLMGVSFLPLPTELLGLYPTSRTAVLLYSGTLAMASFAFWAMWAYAAHGHRLIDAYMDVRMIRWSSRRAMVAPVLYVVSMAVAFFSVPLSLIVLAIIPATYIVVPSRIDKSWIASTADG